MRKRFMIILCVVTGLSVFVAAYNPLVTTILQSDQHALLSGRTMLITLENRETSQLKTFPVNYLREGDMVYIGSDFGWEKHLAGGAEVRMLMKGTEYVGWALPVLGDPERSTAGLKKLHPRTYKLTEWIGSVFVAVRIGQGPNQDRTKTDPRAEEDAQCAAPRRSSESPHAHPHTQAETRNTS